MIDIIISRIELDNKEYKDMTYRCIESFEYTKNHFDKIVEVVDTERHGNAWSWNFGIKNSDNPIILISDNDVIAHRWRETMPQLLEKFDVVFPVVHLTKEGFNVDQRHLAGECFMIKRSLIDKIGYFDEQYGSYFEDTDFFMRVQEVGGKLGIDEGSYVEHKSQGTFKKIMLEEEIKYLFDRNKAIYENKHKTYPHLDT